MENISRLIGKNIRKMRSKMGWTQTQLADASGLSMAGIQKIEAGERTPRRESLEAIAGALKTTVKEILNDSNSIELPALSKEAIEAIVKVVKGIDEPKVNTKREELLNLVSEIPDDSLDKIIPVIRSFLQRTHKSKRRRVSSY